MEGFGVPEKKTRPRDEPENIEGKREKEKTAAENVVSEFRERIPEALDRVMSNPYYRSLQESF